MQVGNVEEKQKSSTRYLFLSEEMRWQQAQPWEEPLKRCQLKSVTDINNLYYFYERALL